MSWCYAAVKTKDIIGGDYWGVKEIYFGEPYTKDPKELMGWTQEYQEPGGETREELISCLEMMLNDLKAGIRFEEIDGKLKEIQG